MRYYYGARLAYGMVAANHGLQADVLFASQARKHLNGLHQLTRNDAIRMFGRRALNDARQYGHVNTHICTDGPCRA